jgi:hypothetical protein
MISSWGRSAWRPDRRRRRAQHDAHGKPARCCAQQLGMHAASLCMAAWCMPGVGCGALTSGKKEGSSFSSALRGSAPSIGTVATKLTCHGSHTQAQAVGPPRVQRAGPPRQLHRTARVRQKCATRRCSACEKRGGADGPSRLLPPKAGSPRTRASSSSRSAGPSAVSSSAVGSDSNTAPPCEATTPVAIRRTPSSASSSPSICNHSGQTDCLRPSRIKTHDLSCQATSTPQRAQVCLLAARLAGRTASRVTHSP